MEESKTQEPPPFWMYRDEPQEQENIRTIGTRLTRVQTIMSTVPHRCSIMKPSEYTNLIARTRNAINGEVALVRAERLEEVRRVA